MEKLVVSSQQPVAGKTSNVFLLQARSDKLPICMSSTRNIANRSPLGLQAGFTLVEMIVAVALFAVVMLVCVSALLSLVNANRRAQALQSVMNNLNIALDGMVRSLRAGSNYDGSADCSTRVDSSNPRDCKSGGTILSFESFGGDTLNAGDNRVYRFKQDGNGVGRIYRSDDGNPENGIPLTSPEVSIDDMVFYVVGTNRGDAIQPKIVIVIKGSAGALGSSARTTFHIQATAVQRVIDI